VALLKPTSTPTPVSSAADIPKESIRFRCWSTEHGRAADGLIAGGLEFLDAHPAPLRCQPNACGRLHVVRSLTMLAAITPAGHAAHQKIPDGSAKVRTVDDWLARALADQWFLPACRPVEQ
jgi:hypothetical protein